MLNLAKNMSKSTKRPAKAKPSQSAPPETPPPPVGTTKLPASQVGKASPAPLATPSTAAGGSGPSPRSKGLGKQPKASSSTGIVAAPSASSSKPASTPADVTVKPGAQTPATRPTGGNTGRTGPKKTGQAKATNSGKAPGKAETPGKAATPNATTPGNAAKSGNATEQGEEEIKGAVGAGAAEGPSPCFLFFKHHTGDMYHNRALYAWLKVLSGREPEIETSLRAITPDTATLLLPMASGKVLPKLSDPVYWGGCTTPGAPPPAANSSAPDPNCTTTLYVKDLAEPSEVTFWTGLKQGALKAELNRPFKRNDKMITNDSACTVLIQQISHILDKENPQEYENLSTDVAKLMVSREVSADLTPVDDQMDIAIDACFGDKSNVVIILWRHAQVKDGIDPANPDLNTGLASLIQLIELLKKEDPTITPMIIDFAKGEMLALEEGQPKNPFGSLADFCLTKPYFASLKEIQCSQTRRGLEAYFLQKAFNQGKKFRMVIGMRSGGLDQCTFLRIPTLSITRHVNVGSGRMYRLGARFDGTVPSDRDPASMRFKRVNIGYDERRANDELADGKELLGPFTDDDIEKHIKPGVKESIRRFMSGVPTAETNGSDSIQQATNAEPASDPLSTAAEPEADVPNVTPVGQPDQVALGGDASGVPNSDDEVAKQNADQGKPEGAPKATTGGKAATNTPVTPTPKIGGTSVTDKKGTARTPIRGSPSTAAPGGAAGGSSSVSPPKPNTAVAGKTPAGPSKPKATPPGVTKPKATPSPSIKQQAAKATPVKK